MNIWIVTDMHLHHQLMLENGYRPNNYQDKLFRRWRSQIKENDVVIDLGDTTWDNSKLKEELDSLPGKKILVMGNHNEKPATWYMTHGFDLAVEEMQMVFQGVTIVFTHEPQTIIMPIEAINICGHWHNNDHRSFGVHLTEWHRLMALEGTKHPGSDAILMGYRPFNLKEIIKLTDAKHCQSLRVR